MTEPNPAFAGIDTSTPNVARIYDYLLGGKDNFTADRMAADQLVEAIPDVAEIARDNRSFLGRAVRYLAAEAGIRQYLDLGSGLPTQANVHELAQGVAADVRVVYVDNDQVVASHGRAMPAFGGQVAMVFGDLRDPASILSDPEGQGEAAANIYRQASSQLHTRSLPDVARFFDGFELVEPGLTWITQWRPEPGTEPTGRPHSMRGAVGRKP
jgi:hypothetical protein